MIYSINLCNVAKILSYNQGHTVHTLILARDERRSPGPGLWRLYSGSPVGDVTVDRTLQDQSKPMNLFKRAVRAFVILLTIFLGGYLLVAYLLLPEGWRHYEHHPSLATFPKVTTNADGIPGDPLNVGLIGTREEVMAAFTAAGWYRADPLGLGSDLEIAESVVLGRPDPNAPVSQLYLWGRPRGPGLRETGGSERPGAATRALLAYKRDRRRRPAVVDWCRQLRSEYRL